MRVRKCVVWASVSDLVSDQELPQSFLLLLDELGLLECDCTHYHILFNLRQLARYLYLFSVANCANALLLILESLHVVTN